MIVGVILLIAGGFFILFIFFRQYWYQTKWGITYLRRQTEREPHDEEKAVQLIYAYMGRQEYEKARQTAESLLQYQRTDSKINTLLGTIYCEQQQLEQALHCFERAIQAGTEEASPYLMAGKLHEHFANHERAEQYMQQAFELDSRYRKYKNVSFFNDPEST